MKRGAIGLAMVNRVLHKYLLMSWLVEYKASFHKLRSTLCDPGWATSEPKLMGDHCNSLANS